jgi:hypothetical protein
MTFSFVPDLESSLSIEGAPDNAIAPLRIINKPSTTPACPTGNDAEGDDNKAAFSSVSHEH